MEKYLLDPKASDAFTSEVMHKVVLNGIDFELPDDIWDAMTNFVYISDKLKVLYIGQVITGC